MLSSVHRWSGSALIVGGAIAASWIAVTAPADRAVWAWWSLTNGLAPSTALPLASLGIGLGLAGKRARSIALALFTAGVALGFWQSAPLIALAGGLPWARDELTLIAPFAFVAVGIALAAPAPWRGGLLPASAPVAGIVLALINRLTDPGLHDTAIPIAGIVIGFWIILAAMLATAAFRQPWFAVAIRIVGSWLVAIGLLYGGVSFIPKRIAAPAPVALPDSIDQTVPDGAMPDQSPTGCETTDDPLSTCGRPPTDSGVE